MYNIDPNLLLSSFIWFFFVLKFYAFVSGSCTQTFNASWKIIENKDITFTDIILWISI